MTLMLDSRRIKHGGLRRFAKRGDASKLPPGSKDKIVRILGGLRAAVTPQDLDMPGYGFHELRGPKKGTYSVWVTRNYRITFKWDDMGPFDVNMEDYHDG